MLIACKGPFLLQRHLLRQRSFDVRVWSLKGLHRLACSDRKISPEYLLTSSMPESVHVIDALCYDIGIRLGLIAADKVVIFDTGTGTTFEDAILRFMKRITLKKIHKATNLHGHQDRIGSNAQLKENYGTEIMSQRTPCYGSANHEVGQ